MAVAEKNRADELQTLLEAQRTKTQSYSQKLTELQKAYEELRDSAEKKSKMEEEIRKNLELRYKTLAKELGAMKKKKVISFNLFNSRCLRYFLFCFFKL